MFRRYQVTKKVSPDILNEKVIFGPSGRFARNRILKSAMSERLGSWIDGDLLKSGIPTQQYCNLYEKFGNGGFGTILTGNILIDSDHLEGAGNIFVDENLDSHERREGFRKAAAAGKSDGSIFIGQLNHCGAQTLAIFNKNPFSSSNVKVDTVKAGAEFGDPIPLTIDQIKHLVVDKFAYAARYLYEMGFDGCEIHGANGFLLAEFMSPKFNKRTDEYGGTRENRIRIVLEVFEAIRKLVPVETGFIVGIKMNSVEFQNDGFNVEDAIWMCQQFENVGFDFIELSGGNFENMGLDNTRHLSKNKREAYFYEFARQIKPQIPITTVFVTGGFRTLPAMVSAIKDNVADGIGLARPAAAEPDIARKILKLNVQSATLNAIVDTRLQLMAAMTQLVQAGKTSLAKSHQEPCYGLLDTSNKQETDKFIPEFLKFIKEKESELAQGKVVNVAYSHPILF